MVLGVLIPAVAPAVLGAGLGARGGPLEQARGEVPKVKPGEILQIALATQALSEAGRTLRLTTDPFTGGLVISAADQDVRLFDLLGEQFAREELRATPAESQAIFDERQRLIESRRLNPVFPTDPTPLPPVTEVRQQVVQELVRETPREVAPGVVSSARPGATPRRLGGPCAGVTTGFSRLNCARGGIS